MKNDFTRMFESESKKKDWLKCKNI
jgi:hypothetical protein